LRIGRSLKGRGWEEEGRGKVIERRDSSELERYMDGLEEGS
jgi:hypothetical protein